MCNIDEYDKQNQQFQRIPEHLNRKRMRQDVPSDQMQELNDCTYRTWGGAAANMLVGSMYFYHT